MDFLCNLTSPRTDDQFSISFDIWFSFSLSVTLKSNLQLLSEKKTVHSNLEIVLQNSLKIVNQCRVCEFHKTDIFLRYFILSIKFIYPLCCESRQTTGRILKNTFPCIRCMETSFSSHRFFIEKFFVYYHAYFTETSVNWALRN